MKTVEFDWKPDKDSREPVYKQIIQYVREKVGSGDWVIGSRLPSACYGRGFRCQ